MLGVSYFAGEVRAEEAGVAPSKLNIGVRSIVCKSTSGGNPALNMFWPESHKATDRRAVIVLFFGGGWVSGKPQQMAAHARYFARAGYVAISAKYRVRNKDGAHLTPSDCVEDGKSAVRFLRKHAAELGNDPDKITSGGGSAGGHVAACSGVIQGYDAKDENAKISLVPNALILFNPVIDATEKGYGADKNPKDNRALSPFQNVCAGLPPTYIVHGTADRTMPFENVERFNRLMLEAGNVCRLLPFEGRGHGFFNAPGFKKGTKEAFAKIMKGALSFLAKQGLTSVTKDN
ncbi:alpha/beta hydrolase [bacterium]|nr:alpha/beta hydrolase [bacterium]